MWSAWYCPHILYPPWSSENLFLARFEGHIWLLIVFDVIYSWWGRHVQASLETGRPVFLRLTVFRAWVAGLQREPLWSSLSPDGLAGGFSWDLWAARWATACLLVSQWVWFEGREQIFWGENWKLRSFGHGWELELWGMAWRVVQCWIFTF